MTIAPVRTLTLAALALAAAAGAERQPLGQIESVDAGAVAIRFDGAARLTPGGMVAIYGPGKVVKHPLTREVIIEERALLAKAQLLTVAQPAQARVLWQAPGASLAKGLDAVPLPGEAAPNAAPVAPAPASLSGPAGGVVPIALPCADADGDPLLYTWEISGPSGASGRLLARTTGGGDNQLILPATASAQPIAVTAIARDPLGQTATATATVQVGPPADAAGRTLKPAARWGGEHAPAVDGLVRDAAGAWWLLADGAVRAVAAGWTGSQPLAWTKEDAPQRPAAIAVRGQDLLVLDAGRKQVLVFRANGSLVRSIGELSAPTDLAVAADGTIFVADQGLGGVAVIEASGKMRGILGRAGSGDDAFAGLARIALSPAGELACLDAKQRTVQRFDRFQRRIDVLAVPGGADDAAIDLAYGPRGLHVLLASGKAPGVEGSARGTALRAIAETGWVAKPAAATAIAFDQNGEAIVAYADGCLLRHDPAGAVAGLRGPALYGAALWCADGRGRSFAVDETGVIAAFDQEGWQIARFGGPAKSGGAIGEAVAIAAVPDGSAVAVLDGKQQAVHRFATADLAQAARAAPLSFGKPGEYNGQFKDARSIACDEAGRIYVLDVDMYRVSAFDPQGKFLFAVGAYGKGPTELREPTLVAVAPAGDALYVFDENKYELKKFALDQAAAKGAHVTNAGGKGDATGQFRSPIAIAVDRQGLLWVADKSRLDVQVLDFRGNSMAGLTARKAADLGSKGLAAAAFGPDGLARIAYDGILVEVR